MHQQGVPMETEEIYDVLMECLVNTINGYDPDYKDKVKLVAGVITDELSKRRLFTAADVNRHVGLDSSRYLRLLCRVGFLEKVPPHRVEATTFSKQANHAPEQCPSSPPRTRRN